jgi:phosphonoacetaldehyde hydrolase
MADGAPERPYRGPLRAVIFDWAGTTVDYGSRAPAGVFLEVFGRRGVPVTIEQARGPMGMHKRDHIAALLALPPVTAMWRELHGRPPEDADVQSMYEELVPLQLACLRDYADVISGTIAAVEACRKRGMKIGSTTGYNRPMIELLLGEAKRGGYEPDCAVCVDDVPAGRPHPYMALRAAILMESYPMEAIVKVGDTAQDVYEGLNAGMWTVGVAKTGNEIGLSEAEVRALPPDELATRLERARERLRAAGAHEVIDGVGDLPPVLDAIEARLAKGERP